MSKHNPEHGGMLIWAATVLFLFSVAMVVVTQAYMRTSRGAEETGQRLAALGIAEREMERLKAVPFAALPANGQSRPAWRGLDALPNARGLLSLSPGAVAGMRQIVVRVEWRSGAGPDHAVELVALRSPRGG